VADRTIRIRWRPDVSALARWTDPQGRPWLTRDYAEVGRRRFIDVAIERPGLTSTTSTGDFTPPLGWHLVERGTLRPVEELVIAEFYLIDPVSGRWRAWTAADGAGTRVGLGFRVPADGAGWSCHPPLVIPPANADPPVLSIPVQTASGRHSYLTWGGYLCEPEALELAGMLSARNLAPGDTWPALPAEGIALAPPLLSGYRGIRAGMGQSELMDSLEPGDILTILERT